MYTVDDIQVCIATHNRIDLLPQTIDSILNQSNSPQYIYIYDNESTDGTEEFIKNKYGDRIIYKKTYGFLGNFYEIQKTVSKPYTMVFHDDDIFHPDYLKFAVKLLNKHNDISAIVTKFNKFKGHEPITDFPKINKNYQLFPTLKDFLKYMFLIEGIAYASAIYKTEYFKILDLEYDKYGKFNDWPFMAKFGQFGPIILVNDENVYYARIHNDSDTNNENTSLTAIQAINWVKFLYQNSFVNNKETPLRFWDIKALYFLYGRYKAFLKKSEKEKYSLFDFYNLARENGLNLDEGLKYFTQKDRKDYVRYQNKLRLSFSNSKFPRIMILINNLKAQLKYFGRYLRRNG